MKTCEPQLAMYEQSIDGLEALLEGRTQVWQFKDEWFEVPYHERWPSWPADYELVAALDTSALQVAFGWSNQWLNAETLDSEIIFIFPYGRVAGPNGVTFSDFTPRSTTVGDVFVKPDGSVHRVCSAGFLQLIFGH